MARKNKKPRQQTSGDPSAPALQTSEVAEERCRELALAAQILVGRRHATQSFQVLLRRAWAWLAWLLSPFIGSRPKPCTNPAAPPHQSNLASRLHSRRLDLAPLVASCNLFDPCWYQQRYPDATLSGADPLTHYLEVGLWLDRAPGPNFDVLDYRRKHNLCEPLLPAFLHYVDKRHTGKPLSIFQANSTAQTTAPDHYLFGFIDLPLRQDMIGHDYIRVIGWCYLYGLEVASVRAELSGSRHKTPLRYGIYRPDVAVFKPDLRYFNVGFQGDVYPATRGHQKIELVVSARTSTGFIHTMRRDLLADPTAERPPDNKYAAVSELGQSLNGEALHRL